MTATGDALRRAAVLEAAVAVIGGALDTEREGLLDPFITAYEDDGTRSRVLRLPGLGRVGLCTVYDPGTGEHIEEPALLAWAEEEEPENVRDVVAPGAWVKPEVIALIKERFPKLVSREVKPPARKRLIEQATRNEGRLLNPETGKTVYVVEVTEKPCTGRHMIKLDDGAAERIIRAYRDGRLDVPIDVLAVDAIEAPRADQGSAAA